MRIVVTKTQIWEEEVPELGITLEEVVQQLISLNDPDYEAVQVDEL